MISYCTCKMGNLLSVEELSHPPEWYTRRSTWVPAIRKQKQVLGKWRGQQGRGPGQSTCRTSGVSAGYDGWKGVAHGEEGQRKGLKLGAYRVKGREQRAGSIRGNGNNGDYDGRKKVGLVWGTRLSIGTLIHSQVRFVKMSRTLGCGVGGSDLTWAWF